MTLFMASSVAAETPERHNRPKSVSNQQHSANYKVAGKNNNLASTRRGKRVARTDTASSHRNLRKSQDNIRVSRAGSTANRRDFRNDRPRDRHDGREQHRDYAYRSSRNHGLLTIFNYRPYYPYEHRRSRYIPLSYHGLNYFYNNGAYYRYSGFGFTLVNNNIGIFLYSLPFGYRSLTIGGYPYYFANRHYYIRDYVRNVYVQVDDPYQTSGWYDADNDSSGYQELIVYPKQGQTAEQMKQDEYECYLWAVDQTGFDPSLGKEGNLEDYQRAKSACLEGRGYVVN